MSNHTPGTWRANGRAIEADHDDRVTVPVASCYTDDEVPQGAGEWEANARLIAAAPDLLAALKALYRATCQLGITGDPAQCQASAAIDRAEGRA